jgi:hypothetical protein
MLHVTKEERDTQLLPYVHFGFWVSTFTVNHWMELCYRLALESPAPAKANGQLLYSNSSHKPYQELSKSAVMTPNLLLLSQAIHGIPINGIHLQISSSAIPVHWELNCAQNKGLPR